MNSEIVETVPWPRRRWWAIIGSILGLQIALIFGLSEHGPLLVRPSPASPKLDLASQVSPELLALYDPTLFALPHPQGFSGLAWLKASPQEVPGFDWDEPTNWLAMNTGVLGADFHRFVSTNRSEFLQAQFIPRPKLSLPEALPMFELPQKSSLRIEGGLAGRRLLTALDLPAWPARTNSAAELDMLTNSVIQAVVDSEGKPVSVTLLIPSGSGLQAADEYALAQARNFRFEPLPQADGQSDAPHSLAGLTWGTLIFEWCTRGAITNP